MIAIDSPNDPRLELYVGLTDKNVRNTTDLFLAESPWLVERLIDSGLRLQSLLCSEKRAARWRQRWPSECPMYVCSDAVLAETVGFKMHQGVIAAGYVPPEACLERAVRSSPDSNKPQTLVVCPEITNVENLGVLVRVAAGLGADAMLLGERCADPWYRRAVRLSMGAVFKLPIVRNDNIGADLQRLRTEFNFDVVGTALRDDAQDLRDTTRGERLAVVLGGEGHGLSDEHLALCNRVVTIPMHHGTDSLNVAVAAGIVLHHFSPHPAD